MGVVVTSDKEKAAWLSGGWEKSVRTSFGPENLFQVLQVLASDKNVVNVGAAEAETAQDTIDEALESLGGIP